MMFNEDFWIRYYDKKFRNDFGEEFQPGWYFYTYDYREIGPFHSKEDTLTAMRDYSESEGDIDYSEEINGKEEK